MVWKWSHTPNTWLPVQHGHIKTFSMYFIFGLGLDQQSKNKSNSCQSPCLPSECALNEIAINVSIPIAAVADEQLIDLYECGSVYLRTNANVSSFFPSRSNF